MKFKKESIDQFVQVFEEYKDQIRNAPGCTHLRLLQATDDPSIFSTFSHWENAESLYNYRHSSTFKEVWPLTKALFDAKPEAWSFEEKYHLD